MVVLGLILVLVAVVAGIVLVVENSGNVVSVSAFGGEWRVDSYWLAVVGAAILLVAVLGIALMRAGGRRGLRKRQERKQLERENAALAERVRHERVEHEPVARQAPVADHRVDDHPSEHGAYDPSVERDDAYDRPSTTTR